MISLTKPSTTADANNKDTSKSQRLADSDNHDNQRY